jgi:hypothetical protein
MRSARLRLPTLIRSARRSTTSTKARETSSARFARRSVGYVGVSTRLATWGCPLGWLRGVSTCYDGHNAPSRAIRVCCCSCLDALLQSGAFMPCCKALPAELSSSPSDASLSTATPIWRELKMCRPPQRD